MRRVRDLTFRRVLLYVLVGVIVGMIYGLLAAACGSEDPPGDLGSDPVVLAQDPMLAPPPIPLEPVEASSLPPREVPPPWLPDEDPWDPEGLLDLRPPPGPEPPPCEACR